MSESVEKIIGPRVPAKEMRVHRRRYLAPTVLFLLAAFLLVASIFEPYWQLTLHAPQYPNGLTVEAYLNNLTGDVNEIDGLNHYIGMRPLDEAAPFEKSVSVLGVADITQMGKVYASGSFRFFETYSIVAYIYLILTIGLSLALRRLEQRMRRSYSAG